jgi:hypothetical protein
MRRFEHGWEETRTHVSNTGWEETRTHVSRVRCLSATSADTELCTVFMS